MNDQESHDKNSIPLLERIVGVIGFLMVAGIVIYLISQAIWGNHSPPTLLIEQTAITAVENGYLVQAKVTNQGGMTAANVIIEGELMQEDESIETSEASIDYIAAESNNHIGLFFTQDPAQYTLELRALGYQEP